MSTNTTSRFSSLPAWTYSNEEFYELEKRAIFRNSWQIMCHLSNIPQRGDYYTFNFLNERALVVRGRDGEVRAFHNVCRHRGARILDEVSGSCKGGIVCPYHAWTYDLEGNLKGVPHKSKFADLETATHGLVPLEMEIFLGFIFVRFHSEAGDTTVAEKFAPYMNEIEPYRFEELQPMARQTLRPRGVNWKNIADNYVDVLHIPVVHEGLTGLVGKTYGIDVKGDIHKAWGDFVDSPKQKPSVRAYRKFLPKVEHLPKHQQEHWLYFRMWPNFAFDIYPDQIDFMQFIPLSATTTLIREIPYALPDDRREMKAARYLNWRINREVNAEDTDLVDRMQDGMASSSFTTGPLAKNEVCLLDSVRRIQDAIPVAREPEEPLPGTVVAMNEVDRQTAAE